MRRLVRDEHSPQHDKESQHLQRCPHSMPAGEPVEQWCKECGIIGGFAHTEHRWCGLGSRDEVADAGELGKGKGRKQR